MTAWVRLVTVMMVLGGSGSHSGSIRLWDYGCVQSSSDSATGGLG